MTIKVSTSNFYVGNTQTKQDAHTLASLDCLVSGVQEGHSGNAQAIRKALAKTHHVWWRHTENNDRQRAFQDVPIVYKHGLKVKKRWARQISKRSQVENIGMPRAASALRFVLNGRTYTFINTHTNAAVQNRTTKAPLSTKVRRVAEFVKGMVVLEAMIANARRKGDLVIVVGDLNFSEQKSGIWKFSPQALFKRNGMDYVVHNIDYIGFSRELKAGRREEVPPTQTGSDHAWLAVTLNLTHTK